MNARRLAVKKERLSELTTDDLNRVAGAAATVGGLCLSLFQNCGSVNVCSTVASCGCPLTYECSNNCG